MRFTPEQVAEKLCDLADDFEKLRAILDTQEPLFDAMRDEVFNNIQAQRIDLFNADNQDLLSLAVISKLNKDEKEAIFRAEYPKLYDEVSRAQKAMKRIEKSFEFFKAIDISNMSSRKHERETVNYKT